MDRRKLAHAAENHFKITHEPSAHRRKLVAIGLDLYTSQEVRKACKEPGKLPQGTGEGPRVLTNQDTGRGPMALIGTLRALVRTLGPIQGL